MTKTFLRSGESTELRRVYVNGPFTLILRAVGGPWLPENIVPEIRAKNCPMAVCRAIRDRDDPCALSIALDLSGVPELLGMSGADRLKNDLDNAGDLAKAIKTTIENECPGITVNIEP